jgi:hypothetical protein
MGAEPIPGQFGASKHLLTCYSDRGLLSERAVSPMFFEATLDEVDQLHNVSTRLEGLAEQHSPVSEALITIAGSVRGTATIWLCWFATKTPNRFEAR